jgi:hypothetical protein
MRVLRNLLLFAVLSAALISLASPAAAQTLEVVDESSFEHCPSVAEVTHGATGGCVVHFSSTAPFVLRIHTFGIESTTNTCTSSEFSIRFDEDAGGYAVNQGTTGCTDLPCFEGTTPSDKIPWQVTGSESGGSEVLRIAFCHSELNNLTCVTDAPLRAINGHQLELGTKINGVPQEMPRVSGAVQCEMAGHWVTETGGPSEVNVEIVHI